MLRKTNRSDIDKKNKSINQLRNKIAVLYKIKWGADRGKTDHPREKTIQFVEWVLSQEGSEFPCRNRCCEIKDLSWEVIKNFGGHDAYTIWVNRWDLKSLTALTKVMSMTYTPGNIIPAREKFEII